jgi:hypothetical protein
MEQDHDAKPQSERRSPRALKDELTKEELELVFGGGTSVGNPGKLEQAFHNLLISTY